MSPHFEIKQGDIFFSYEVGICSLTLSYFLSDSSDAGTITVDAHLLLFIGACVHPLANLPCVPEMWLTWGDCRPSSIVPFHLKDVICGDNMEARYVFPPLSMN